jgi:hypothetical protein
MSLGSGVGNTALFSNAMAGSLTVTGQGGHDALTVSTAHLMGDLTVSLMGNGADSIALDSIVVDGNTSLRTTGGSSSIAIDDQAPGSTFGGRTDITMMGRYNFLSINSKHRTPETGLTTFQGAVSAQLGSASTLNLALIGMVDFESATRIDGGGSRNVAVVGAGDITGHPTLVHFS